jgi:hypothetical protein
MLYLLHSSWASHELGPALPVRSKTKLSASAACFQAAASKVADGFKTPRGLTAHHVEEHLQAHRQEARPGPLRHGAGRPAYRWFLALSRPDATEPATMRLLGSLQFSGPHSRLC